MTVKLSEKEADFFVKKVLENSLLLVFIDLKWVSLYQRVTQLFSQIFCRIESIIQNNHDP